MTGHIDNDQDRVDGRGGAWFPGPRSFLGLLESVDEVTA